mgnify:CR=1 FL=1
MGLFAVFQEQEDADESEECTSEPTEHELLEHSFSSLQRCHKCNKYLYGIIRQGLQCQGNRMLFLTFEDEPFNFKLLSFDPDCNFL